jgi:hypothetical protein
MLVQKRLPVQFGPYSATEAEQITEEALGSKELYTLLEQLLRGDITNGEFNYSLQFLTESIHATLLERERELKAEAYLEEA